MKKKETKTKLIYLFAVIIFFSCNPKTNDNYFYNSPNYSNFNYGKNHKLRYNLFIVLGKKKVDIDILSNIIKKRESQIKHSTIIFDTPIYFKDKILIKVNTKHDLFEIAEFAITLGYQLRARGMDNDFFIIAKNNEEEILLKNYFLKSKTGGNPNNYLKGYSKNFNIYTTNAGLLQDSIILVSQSLIYDRINKTKLIKDFNWFYSK